MALETNSDRYLSLKELCEYTSLSESTLRGLLSEIPHLRLRRKILVKKSEFDGWLRRRRLRREHVDPSVREFVQKIMKGANGSKS